MVIDKVAVLLVAIVKVVSTRVAFLIVALLEDVNGKVASTSNAIVKLVTVLEDVDGKVASTSVAVVKVATALEVVRLVAGLVEAWEQRPSQARLIALTAVRRV